MFKPVGYSVLLAAVGVWVGCDWLGGLPPGIVPTEDTAYVGSAACGACHSDVAAHHSRHGHSQALKPVLGGPPTYPAGAAGVPDSPAGLEWQDISYVIGGYEKAARFADLHGFVLTDGTTGANTQYNAAIPEIGMTAGFVPYRPTQAEPLPFDDRTFRTRTTGPQSLAENGGRHQDNRPGIGGTWAAPGVQCEACHGPGSRHVPDPSAGNINLDADSASCSRCHVDPDDPDVIAASDGLIAGLQQAAEVAASPHEGFSCTACHDPHASVIHDRAAAIRNDCRACHAAVDMALHQGFVFTWGDYAEPVTCESCHMPYAVKTAAAVDLQLANGRTARWGDTRSHIMILDPGVNGLAEMFTADGTRATRDQQGRASVSTCYVCQRCHNGLGNAFAFLSNEGCAFGTGIHQDD